MQLTYIICLLAKYIKYIILIEFMLISQLSQILKDNMQGNGTYDYYYIL